jgi:hypothetical protein
MVTRSASGSITRFIDSRGAPIAGGMTHAMGPEPSLKVAMRVPSALSIMCPSEGTSMPRSVSEMVSVVI